VLDDEPILADALQSAGFALAVKPGTWARDQVQIDPLAPKDGLDVLRILQGVELARLGVTLAALDRHTLAGPTTREALYSRRVCCSFGMY